MSVDALQRAIAAVDPGALARYLADQRWFGAKGRAIADAAIVEVAPLPGDDEPAAFARVAVRLADGGALELQLPLALRRDGAEPTHATASTPPASKPPPASGPSPASEPPPAPGPSPTRGPSLPPTATGALVDATGRPGFHRQLARLLAQGASVAGPESRWECEPLADLAALPDLPARPAEGEQSNTSILFGDCAIFKLYRRLERGQNPDVEIARFLTTRTDFRGTPPLLGVLHLRGPRGDAVAGMLQAFERGAVDGWNHVLARLRGDADPARRDAELERLGALTRELHVALASAADDPEFAPEPTRDGDLERWQAAAAAQLAAALERLDAQKDSLAPPVAASARALLARADELRARLQVAPGAADLGPRIRHHGDYHLGQVLHTPGGWRVIDFEGEPARPLAERRAKHHPLRDVAGMLRSFAYAAAVAAQARAGPAMCAAFLRGYDPTLRDDPRRSGLLALFSAEKLFYELSYELGSRPDWVWIPLAAAAELLDRP